MSNLPKHQPEVAEDVKPQSSFAEPVVNSAPAQQETMTSDIRQESLTDRTVASRESWSEEMEDQAAQLDFKSAMPTQAPVPPPQAPQHPPLAPIPPPQPTFFSPGPPFKQVESQQAEKVEEHYANQWTGGARFDDLQKAEPILPKGKELLCSFFFFRVATGRRKKRFLSTSYRPLRPDGKRERDKSGNETAKDILHLCSQLLLSRVTEPEPTKKTEEKPVKKNEPKRGSPVSSSCSHFMFHFFFFFHLSLTPSIQKIIV